MYTFGFVLCICVCGCGCTDIPGSQRWQQIPWRQSWRLQAQLTQILGNEPLKGERVLLTTEPSFFIPKTFIF